MIARLAAAVWALAAGGSAFLVFRGLLATRSADDHERVARTADDLLAVTQRIGRVERYTSLVVAVASVVAFFGSELNTQLWPSSTLAWVALLAQSMFLRPYLTNYAELIGRGFERALDRVLVPYVALDAIMVVLLARLVADATT